MRSIKKMGPRKLVATTVLVVGLFTGGGIAALAGPHSVGLSHPPMNHVNGGRHN